MKRLYTPPPGFIDQPFLYIFDGSTLVDGQNALNRDVQIVSGWGDFIMRRILGMDRILSNSGTAPFGQFQFRDYRGRYFQEVPECVGTGGVASGSAQTQIAMVPEQFYPELGSIKFDLYNVLRATAGTIGVNNIYASQLGFHGVRRVPGTLKPPPYKYRDKTYIYITQAFLSNTVNADGTPGPPQAVRQPIENYDFDLYQLIVNYDPGSFEWGNENQPIMQGVPTFPLKGPIQSIVLNVVDTGVPLTPFSINTVLTPGSTLVTITVTLQTDGGGSVITTGSQLVSLFNANALASSYITLSCLATCANPVASAAGLTFLGGPTNPSLPQCNLMLYDQNVVQTYSAPALDLFVNALSYYGLGAIVPPLYFKQQAQMRLDFYSLATTPLFVTVMWVGRQRIPCS